MLMGTYLQWQVRAVRMPTSQLMWLERSVFNCAVRADAQGQRTRRCIAAPRPDIHAQRKAFSPPDLVVICGEPQYHDEHTDVILNPSVIIEVLSESTESFDRGEKFHRYRAWNPTSTDYLLVSQTAPIIEHFSRQLDGSWSYRIYQGLERSVTI